MIGIENVHEFYTHHYLAAIIQNDIKPVIQKWLEAARQGDEKTPHRQLAALQQRFFRFKDRMGRLKTGDTRVAAHMEIKAALLDILGYQVKPLNRHVPSGPLPLMAELKRSDGSPLLWELRLIKTPRELAYIKKACRAADKGIRAGWRHARVGMSEREIRQHMAAKMIEAGADRIGFLPITSGPGNYERFTMDPTNRRVKKGDIIWTDVGVAVIFGFTVLVGSGVLVGGGASHFR